MLVCKLGSTFLRSAPPPPPPLIVNREMFLLTNSCEWQLLKAHVCYKTGKLSISLLFYIFLWGETKFCGGKSQGFTTSVSIPAISIIPAPKTLLRHHQPELVQYINLESLVPYLNQQQLLTDDENDTLLNLYLSNRIRVIKLLQFMETKGDEGFQRFLKAIAYEQDHMGHAEIAKLLAPYRKLVCM